MGDGHKRERARGMCSGASKTGICLAVYRFIQMILAIAVIGLYAQDLNKARKEGKYSDGKWVFAVVVSSLSSVTALAYLILTLCASYHAQIILFAWDWILTVLWAALLGIFGPMYIHENPEMDAGVARMKHAVIVDGVNLGLWGLSAIFCTVAFFRGDRADFLPSRSRSHSRSRAKMAA